MAYKFDQYDSSIVVDGFEAGVADSPFGGISDMRNVNIISVPGEGSVNFATQAVSPPAITATVTSRSSNTLTFTGGGNLENRMAIQFNSVGSLTGVSTGTIYWIGLVSPGSPSNTSASVYSDLQLASIISLGGTAGGANFSTYTVNQPKYSTYDSLAGTTWMVDALGLVWTNAYVSGAASNFNYWVYAGNKPNNGSNGNGIVYYQASDGTNQTGYIFVFSNSSIDFTPSASSSISWTYQWDFVAGTAGSWSATPTRKLKTGAGTFNPHEAFVAPDSKAYFTDGNWIGQWFQNDPTVAFVPTTLSTYTPNQYGGILPTTDRANCLTFLGSNILIGGKNNIIYVWDAFSPSWSSVILLPEFNVVKLVTVNTNTFIFVGNRGRIYYTNGSQAQLYKKIPDHISGTVEPYFAWGGATSVKNQLYFSAIATTNSGSAITQYGGVWAIDLDSKALRLTNKLSYASYAGYATTLIPNFAGNPAGTGLWIGWDKGDSATYGIDTTISTPYTNSEATIDSDLIPIGTYQKPRDLTKVEYRLTRPLVSGESVTIKTRLIFNTSNTGYTTTLTDSTVGHYSGLGDINFANAQWVQFQVVLNSTASSPSYVRLKEIRILGLTGPTIASSQQLSL